MLAADPWDYAEYKNNTIVFLESSLYQALLEANSIFFPKKRKVYCCSRSKKNWNFQDKFQFSVPILVPVFSDSLIAFILFLYHYLDRWLNCDSGQAPSLLRAAAAAAFTRLCPCFVAATRNRRAQHSNRTRPRQTVTETQHQSAKK